MNSKHVDNIFQHKSWLPKNVAPFIAIFILTIASCSKNQAEAPTPAPPKPGGEVTNQNVSFNNYAKGFFQSKCNACHGTGGIGSSKWLYSDYASVKNDVARLNNVLFVTKTMPPAGLNAKETELIKAWFDRSNPEN